MAGRTSAPGIFVSRTREKLGRTLEPCIYIYIYIYIRETGQFSPNELFYDFIGNLNRLTVSWLINDSASD